MPVLPYERALRRLRGYHEKTNYGPVGVADLSGAGTVQLFRAWDDRLGEVEVGAIRPPWLDLYAVRRIAAALMGRDVLVQGTEFVKVDEDGAAFGGEVVYVRCLDRRLPPGAARSARFPRPRGCRWYSGQQLAATLGGGAGNGFWERDGRRLLPVTE